LCPTRVDTPLSNPSFFVTVEPLKMKKLSEPLTLNIAKLLEIKN
jgi:hypothetical protein